MLKTKSPSRSVCYYISRGCWVARWYELDGRSRIMRLPHSHNKESAESEFRERRPPPAPAKPKVKSEVAAVNVLAKSIEVFERHVLCGLRKSTRLIYRQVFGLLQQAGIRTIADFTPERLLSLKDVLIAEGMSPATQAKLLRTVKRFMRWLHEVGYLSSLPKIPMPRVRKKSKGRPLTDAEFELLLASVDTVYVHRPQYAESCKRLLRGLWLSGLRIGEMDVSWDDRFSFHVDWQRFKHPVFVMPDEFDKTAQCRVFPMTPEFWNLIKDTPESERTGPIFQVYSSWRHETLNSERASRLIQRVGEVSGVVVDRTGDKVKYASAHDLRRSFGLRWASRVNSVQLGQLMRHSDPKTTEIYYLGQNAAAILDGLWE